MHSTGRAADFSTSGLWSANQFQKKTVPKSTLNKEGTNCSREVKKELGEFCKATDSTKLRHPIDSYPCICPLPHQSNQALTLEPRLGTADLDRLWGSNLGRGNGVGAS